MTTPPFDQKSPTEMPLGKAATYASQYDAKLLFPVDRKITRQQIGVGDSLIFSGVDIWNAYELSWLNQKGKPIVAIANFIFPCHSANLIESKSFKLYLNSLNNSHFDSIEAVKQTLITDLSAVAGLAVAVDIFLPTMLNDQKITSFDGICLDDLDIDCQHNQVCPQFLDAAVDYHNDEIIEETLCSNLLKSNCLVTGQPDWASVQIHYCGKKIDHQNLLKYLVSFRNHNEFHEQCIERIFVDIWRRCQPQKLVVYGRYTRRGGLDINPFRSSETASLPGNIRLPRQ